MHHHNPGLYSGDSITSLSAAEGAAPRRHREAERLRGLQGLTAQEARTSLAALHRRVRRRHCTFEDLCSGVCRQTRLCRSKKLGP